MKHAAITAPLMALCMSLAAPLFAQGAPGVTILMYHKVDRMVPPDAVGRSLTLDPATFEEQLAWLRSTHTTTLTTRELVEALRRGDRPQRAAVLTFDDGYEDAYSDAFPLLKKYGAKASFYVSADFVGTPRHLSWKNLREMRDAGMEIGCHGSRHLDLAVIAPSEKRYEVEHCAAALTRWLGAAPKTYAYAAGQYDAAAISLVRASGFIAALTEHSGAVFDLHRPFELPRRRIDRGDTLASFAASVTP